MSVDYERIAEIVEELRPLDAYQAYYVKDTVQLERIGPLVPPIEVIIRNAFGSSSHVLDVGSGDGRTKGGSLKASVRTQKGASYYRELI